MSRFTSQESDYLQNSRLGRMATVDQNGDLHMIPVGSRYNPEQDTIDIGGHIFVQSKKYRDALKHGVRRRRCPAALETEVRRGARYSQTPYRRRQGDQSGICAGHPSPDSDLHRIIWHQRRRDHAGTRNCQLSWSEGRVRIASEIEHSNIRIVQRYNSQIEIGEQQFEVSAEIVGSEERGRLWARLIELAPGYAAYAKKTHRVIPMVTLHPADK